jgi:hypothetical protein
MRTLRFTKLCLPQTFFAFRGVKIGFLEIPFILFIFYANFIYKVAQKVQEKGWVILFKGASKN